MTISEPEVTSPPATAPVTTADVRTHLGIAHTADDALLDALVLAATGLFEQITQRTLIDTTYLVRLDTFPAGAGKLRLPRSPGLAVVSIAYEDEDGASQTFDDFRTHHVDPYEIEPLAPAEASSGELSAWPTTLGNRSSVEVTFRAGYADAAAVPALYRQAILLLAGAWYEVREDASSSGGRIREAPAPIAAQRILELARVPRVFA